MLYVITYMWNLKNKTNIYTTKHKQTHRHRGQTSGSQWGWGGARWSTGLRDTNYYI